MVESIKSVEPKRLAPPQGDYDPAMLYVNLFAKNYLCVTTHRDQVETNQTSDQILIGAHWKGVTFPRQKPLFVAADYAEFREIATKEFGGMAALFRKSADAGLKIYVQHAGAAPFFYHFLGQIDRAHGLKDDLLALVIKKTNERFWIWDHHDLGLSIEAHKAFQKSAGTLKQEDLLLADKNVGELPIELVLALYFAKKTTKQVLMDKLLTLKEHFIALAMVNVARRNKETIFNNPAFMKSYNGFDIEGGKSLIRELEASPVLKRLFVDGVTPEQVDWVVKNRSEVSKVLSLLDKAHIESRDQEEQEYEMLMDLFYGKTADVKAAGLDRILDAKHFGLHELSFFDVYRHKVNLTMLNYLSVRHAAKL